MHFMNLFNFMLYSPEFVCMYLCHHGVATSSFRASFCALNTVRLSGWYISVLCLHKPLVFAHQWLKGKVFPYSLPSVGPGADPGVQAVSPPLTIALPSQTTRSLLKSGSQKLD